MELMLVMGTLIQRIRFESPDKETPLESNMKYMSVRRHFGGYEHEHYGLKFGALAYLTGKPKFSRHSVKNMMEIIHSYMNNLRV